MEQTTIKNLPDGTLSALAEKAIKNGFHFFNGKPNTAAYIRHLFEKATGVKP